MQLRLSLLTCKLLAVSLMAEDYISVQYIQYDEESGRTSILAPSIEISKDFGVDYNLKMSYVHDAISGASPTWYDSSSGASAQISGSASNPDDIVFGDIDYIEARNAGGLSFTTRFDSRDELIIGANYSDEHDYQSFEGSIEYLHFLDSSKNQSLSLGASYQSNEAIIYCDLNTSECDSSSGGSARADAQVLTTEIGFTQILDKSSLAKASLFYIGEEGYLGNQYMRVVRNYDTAATITEESKPDRRMAYGATLQYFKAFENDLTTQLSYRFYNDDWEIMSHTIDTALYYDVNTDLILGGGVRFYTQSEASFYSDRKDHFTDEEHASSDRRMSQFDSFNYMLSANYKISHDLSVNTSFNYYDQPKHLDAFYYNVGFVYSF